MTHADEDRLCAVNDCFQLTGTSRRDVECIRSKHFLLCLTVSLLITLRQVPPHDNLHTAGVLTLELFPWGIFSPRAAIYWSVMNLI